MKKEREKRKRYYADNDGWHERSRRYVAQGAMHAALSRAMIVRFAGTVVRCVGLTVASTND